MGYISTFTMFKKTTVGGAGYRSRYLSHAKRALYHLSYAPILYLKTYLSYIFIHTYVNHFLLPCDNTGLLSNNILDLQIQQVKLPSFTKLF